MNLSKTLLRGSSITALVMAFLFLAAACGGESTPTATLPTATPAPVLSDVLTNAGEKMAAMSSAKFSMVDEKESGAKFFETTFKSLEAEVKDPDSFRMLVEVVSPAFGFVEIEMMAVGEQALMKFSKDAPWAPLPLDQVPFNFSGLGMTFRDVIPFHIAEAVKCAGRLRVECSIQSQAVSDRTRPGSDSSSPRYASTASIFSSMLPYVLPSTHLRTSWKTRSAGFNSGLYGGWMMVASPTLRTISPR